jgi:hypothetical protein
MNARKRSLAAIAIGLPGFIAFISGSKRLSLTSSAVDNSPSIDGGFAR